MLTREHMDRVDTAWLHMDQPRNAVDIVAMLSFAEPMRLAKLRGLLEQRLLRHARFRQRIVRAGILGGADWGVDPKFDICRHVVPHRLPAGSRRSLEALVGSVTTESLDFRHPPWRAWLVEGYGAGCAVVLKLHHCMGDGFAMRDVLFSLTDEEAVEAPPAQRAPSYRNLTFDAAHLASHAVQFAWSLGRNVVLPPDPRTPLRRPLSGQRRAAWSEGISLSRTSEAAHRLGATVNDFLITALTGALRAYLENAGESVNYLDIRAVVPVNVRPPGSSTAGLGNRFGIVFLELPVHLRTAPARLAGVRQRMAELKGSPDAVMSHAVLGAMGMVPSAVEQPLVDFFLKKASLVVTNVPGPRQPLHMGRNRIDSVMFWVPHPADLGLGVSIYSYADMIRVGVRADISAVARPIELVRRFGEELRALEAA